MSKSTAGTTGTSVTAAMVASITAAGTITKTFTTKNKTYSTRSYGTGATMAAIKDDKTTSGHGVVVIEGIETSATLADIKVVMSTTTPGFNVVARRRGTSATTATNKDGTSATTATIKDDTSTTTATSKDDTSATTAAATTGSRRISSIQRSHIGN